MSSIVLFDDKKDCCGCGACMNVCPKNAIRMAEDEVGFVYPEIDQNLCVGCGACKKACCPRRECVEKRWCGIWCCTSSGKWKIGAKASPH